MTSDEHPSDPTEPAASADDAPWAAPPTVKARAGVQRAVTGLLDALAPERVVSRGPTLRLPIERHRTPRGCVLQAAAAAVSVTWFPDAATETAFGELQVTAWRGVVSRPGSAHRALGGASVAREMTLVPVEDAQGGWGWRAPDGTVYDTDALVAHCAALLEEQIAAADR
jgi:hypothetical protein